MYFTPNGQYAIVVQEEYRRLAFYDPHTWQLHDYLTIPSCKGVDHMDFTADGTKLLAQLRVRQPDGRHRRRPPHAAAHASRLHQLDSAASRRT